MGRSDRNGQARLFRSFHFLDLAGLGPLVSLVGDLRPDLIVHLAAPASVPQSILDPRADLLGHVTPTAQALESIRQASPPTRFLLVSSAAVYGNPETLPVAEDAPLTPISPYGVHKVQQELLVDEFAALHGVRACKARLFSTYGENLCRLAVWEIARRALAGDPEVYGTGQESRDYLDAADVARAVVCLAEHADFRGEAINVGSGTEVSIAELAREIFRLTGLSATPKFSGLAMAGSPIRWRADVRRLLALGWPGAVWSGGLKRTVDWIASQSGLPAPG